MRERIAFLSQFRRQVVTTGAIQPSSRYLARAMTAPLRRAGASDEGRRHAVIEMGPGTGAVTVAIAAAMGPEDTLDCYEINPEFADYLRERVRTDPLFAAARDRITVHHGAAEEARASEAVAFVVCSVPLNNLPAAAVESIFDRGFELLRPGGWFTYFEYPVLPGIKRLFSSAAEQARIDGVAAAKRLRQTAAVESTIVLRNLPPARAVHLRASAGTPTQS